MPSQKRLGVVLTYATQLVQILTGLIYTPIMLRLLGQSEYGLYQLVNSVVAYLSLFSLGFGSSYMRFYSRLDAKGDADGVARLNGMFMTIFLVMAAAALTVGCALIGNIRAVFAEGLTDAEYGRATILMTLMVANMALTFPTSVFDAYSTAKEQFIFQRLVNFLQALLNPFLCLPLLIMGVGSVGMVVVASVLSVAKLVVNWWYAVGRLRMRFAFGQFDWSLFRELGAFTFWIFLNQIMDQINWNVDKFLLGRMVNTGAVAVYGVGAQINSMYLNISTSISSVFVPQINRIVAEGAEDADERLTEVFIKVGRVQFLVVALVATGFIFFGLPFVLIWGGPGYGEAYGVALLLMLPELVPLIQNIGIEIQRAKNKHQVRSIVYFCLAIGNIFVSIALIPPFGPAGAALGTALSLVAGQVLFMNWYYQAHLGINIIAFWKSIAHFFPALVAPVAFGVAVNALFSITHLWQLALAVVAYTAIWFVSMWFLGMNDFERGLMRAPLAKIKARRSK